MRAYRGVVSGIVVGPSRHEFRRYEVGKWQ